MSLLIHEEKYGILPVFGFNFCKRSKEKLWQRMIRAKWEFAETLISAKVFGIIVAIQFHRRT